MPYGVIRKLLSKSYDEDDKVLIESQFEETTRMGSPLRSVVLALTPNVLIIASHDNINKEKHSIVMKSIIQLRHKMLKLSSIHPLEMLKISIFKKTQRQSLKICFYNKITRYFEMGMIDKRKIFWNLWCNHVMEINSDKKIWPFSSTLSSIYTETKVTWEKDECLALDINTQNNEDYQDTRWTDKYLYLGARREAEDSERPVAVPGLGPTEEIKLLYLKPQYFGCWEQSDHWVQCGSCSTRSSGNYNAYTYTGEPTSNVTYTSVITTGERNMQILMQQQIEFSEYLFLSESPLLKQFFHGLQP